MRRIRYGGVCMTNIDDLLLVEANKRMEDNGDEKTFSFDAVMNDLGISEAELLNSEDVDIE